MSVKDDLIAARKLIDTPEKWIKGRPFKNGRLCAEAAVTTACAGRDYRPVIGALCMELGFQGLRADNLMMAYANGGLAYFNDRQATTHADIMALFERAIAAARADQ